MSQVASVLAGALALSLAWPASQAGAQSRLRVAEPAPGRAGAILAGILERPYTLRLPVHGAADYPADSSFGESLVVVGADVTLGSTVRGDVVVIGGSLYLHPGAKVSGRAVSYGGGVYPSAQGEVEGGSMAFRDDAFDMDPATAEDDELVLRHRSTARDYRDAFALTGLYGFRPPQYDRVNGLSVAAGVRVNLSADRLALEPALTYRSDLGELDPALVATYTTGTYGSVAIGAERGTFTNDGWSRPDLLNSLATLAVGSDARNFWRATRVEARASRDVLLPDGPLTLSATGRWEDARSVGPEVGTRSGPWAFRGTNDSTRMLRPNPPVLRGRLVSALVGGALPYLYGDISGDASLVLETPLSSPDDSRWLQATLDASARVPTFGAQQLTLDAHAVATLGDAAPPQRWSYLGGGATIPTLDRLRQGGDMLLYLDAAYLVPLPGPQLALVGGPVVALRYAVGSAGVGSLPAMVQNVGAGLGFGMFRLDFMVDPATGDTAFGLAFTPLR